MENKKALQLIKKIQKDISGKKINIESLIEDLKELRTFSLEEKNPTVTKSLRLAYEHLQNNNAFFIGIPEDLDEDSEVSDNFSSENNIESLQYYIALFTDTQKKNNILDIKAYNQAFLKF